MSKYEEGLKLLEEKFGNGRDNTISLATIAREPNAEGKPRPVVHTVDAYYGNGAFYVTTYGKSNKMKQIAQNAEVSIATCPEMFTEIGIGEDLGWVLNPKKRRIKD
jgi:uncharacterized pyridoxamine 5'-phosphate oxidase family protein